MEALETSPSAASTSAGQLLRSARALIGWMTPQEAKLWLAGRRTDQSERVEFAIASERARKAVATRPVFVDAGTFEALPSDALVDHVEALRQNASSAPYFQEGWRVAVVDLRKVRAIQPHVFVDDSAQRLVGVDPDDVVSLAQISLPLLAPSSLATQFDEARKVWAFSSPNPNLRISGHFGGQIQPGVRGFGFVVSVAASFLQVGSYRGRHLLRDGYHRAYGFISRGITRVPAFVRDFDSYDELSLPAGLLPQGAFLGERPPALVDYMDESVSASVQLPAMHKMVIVQAIEMSSLG